jgi:hypothetical protein
MMTESLMRIITIQIQYVDGRAAHMTNTTRHQSWQSTPPPPPIPDHAGSIPDYPEYLNHSAIHWIVIF